jgi:dTMP kinase
MMPRTEILLFLAARAQHVDALIRPALRKGKIVLCDRFSDSTLAYQGYGHQTDLATLQTLLDFATDGQYPDLTLLLDIPVEKGLERKRANDEEWNRLDAYEIAFHKRVRRGYLTMAAEDPKRWVCINAAQPKAKVQQAMRETILAKLQQKA